MVKKVLAAVAALVVILIVIIAMQSSDFSVSRAVVINAAPEAIFPQINDHKNFAKWSPWAKMDPNTVYTYEGPNSGVGAKVTWSGKEMGEGTSEIVEVIPNKRVMMKLHFTKPMKAINEVNFTLDEKDAQTLVTWSMTGKKDFVQKAMSLFMGCEKMVGNQFVEGLDNLKHLVESQK